MSPCDALKQWNAPGYARFQRAEFRSSNDSGNSARWKRAYPGVF
jgi:hypothetical protein